jgi:hypothetical protein
MLNGGDDETRTRDLCRDSGPVIGFTTTYKYAGTAKVRVSRTRHHIVLVGIYVVAEEKILSCLYAGSIAQSCLIKRSHAIAVLLGGAQSPELQRLAISPNTRVAENILEKIPGIASSKL